jgi:hypothetical protein
MGVWSLDNVNCKHCWFIDWKIDGCESFLSPGKIVIHANGLLVIDF